MQPACLQRAGGLPVSMTPPMRKMTCSGRAIWAGVTQIFEDEAGSKAALPSTEPRDELVSALVELRASLNSPVLWAPPLLPRIGGRYGRS